MKACGFKGGLFVGLLALGAGMGAQARSVAVDAISNGVVSLSFSGGSAAKLAVARGAYDAGDRRADWEAFEIIGDVSSTQSTMTWTVPEGEYRYARFFLLDPNLPFTKCCAFVRSSGQGWIDTGVQARSGVRAELDMTVKTIADRTIIGAFEGNTRFYLMHLNANGFRSISQQLGPWVAPSDKTKQYHNVGWRHTSVVSEILPGSRALYQCSLTPGESATLTQTYALNKTLYLFACNSNGNAVNICDVALIRGKMWLDGELKRDYIPVVADGKGALFDLVSRQVFPDRSGKGFATGDDVTPPTEVYLTAASTETIEIRKPDTLVAHWDFLHDPSAVVGDLPLPRKALADSPWTIRVRFMAPSAGANTARTILQGAPDGIYSISADNQIGPYAVSPDQWHTLTIDGGPARFDSYFDEQNLLSTSADDATTALKDVENLQLATDGSIRYASVEVWRAAGVGEGRYAVETKADMTGEWTFPTDNPQRPTKGRDLEKFANVSSNAFSGEPLTEGVMAGDASMRVRRYCGFRCRHGLATNSNYSVVMDVRVPTGAATGLHGVFQANTFAIADCNLFFRKNDGSDVLDAWVSGGTYLPTSLGCGAWCRVVLTYANGGDKTLYLNGVKIDARRHDAMKIIGPYCYLGVDNSGEDLDLDISYAAIYNRVLTEGEVAADFARPTAHASPSGKILLQSSRVGLWERENGTLVSRVDGAPALTAQDDGGFTLTRASASAGITVVADLKLPPVRSRSGVILANAEGVATGVYGSAGVLNGCLATAPSAAVFATGSDVAGTDLWGGCTCEALWRCVRQRVTVTWDAQGRVRYYVNGQLISPEDPTAFNAAARPTATMTLLSGLGVHTSRLEVYDGALTPFEVASLGGIEFVLPPPGTSIILR